MAARDFQSRRAPGACLTVLLLVGATLRAAQATRTEAVPSSPRSSVTTAVEVWETLENAHVSPAAQKVIAAEFTTVGVKGIPEASVPFLARAYLYESRDRKGVRPGTRFILNAEDVHAFSLSQFVGQVPLDKGIGFLKCISEPEGGDITIDGKARGRTIKEFVLSTGYHTVTTRVSKQECNETVNIDLGATKETHCPRN